MKKTVIISAVLLAVTAVILSLTVFRKRSLSSSGIIGGADHLTAVLITPGKRKEKAMTYTSVTMEEAKKIFEGKGTYIILDVRRADEYASGHIPGAINIANEDIGTTPPAQLPDKSQTIYVYCRSGSRSKQASEKLAAMGYSDIIESGGILSWTGDIEK